GVEGTINTQGDLVLYNGTKNTVVFREVGIAAPSLTNRSAGTKLVLYPNTTASTTDYAIGMNTTSMWFSVDTDADSHKFNFYQATNNVANIGRLGIDLYAADFPLVTRRHDTFTSGTYSGVGRWGLFMEPGAITIGKPTGAGKNFKVSNYNADSTKSDLLTVNDSGDLSLTSTTASTNTTTGSITTPGGVGIGGNLNVGGALAKGSGTFDIPHPNPAKEVMGYRLRHSFVESPTAGDNLYRFAYYIENFLEFSLPEYFGYLNCNVSCWVSCCDSFGIGYGKFIKNSENDCKIKVIVSIPGTYNILVIGTRKDKVAVGNWSSKNIEYRGC
ncbi:MAG TPA: hypothetical protein V6C58_17515, partial [Allocoleopsis sp.]